VKWVVLVVVVILAAPSIAKRLTPAGSQAQGTTGARRKGPLYRAVRRFGLRTVGLGFLALVAALAVLAYLVIRGA
jgi:hypothetical protein